MNRMHLLLVVLVIVSGVFFYQQQDGRGLEVRGAAAAAEDLRSPIAREPEFIFSSTRVRWTELAPKLAGAYGALVEPMVLGTFPVAKAYSGSELAGVQWDAEGIRFPAYGEYYLHTSVGFFKLLLLEPGGEESDKVVKLAAFIAGNTVHSVADQQEMRPLLNMADYAPGRLLPTLFASDQPVKLHCGGAAEFAAYVFRRQGYRTQLVQLVNARGEQVHVVMQLYLPSLDRYVMVDPDYGAMVADETGSLLSVGGLARALRERPDKLRVIDVGGGKRKIKDAFNQVPVTPRFSWMPERSAKRKMLVPPAYLRSMTDYTSEYWTYEWGGPDWDKHSQKKYNWDGSRIRVPPALN